MGFSPYTDNGGTCVGIASKAAAMVVSDTRLSKGYSIHTRKSSKVTQLTSKCVIASCGMKADGITLHKVLKIRIEMYKHEHRKEPSVTAIAQMLSTILYGKRFFPYYTFNVLAGYDDNAKEGKVYHYDAIGSFESVPYTTSGSGSSLSHPVLDQQIMQSNIQKQFQRNGELPTAKLIELCKDTLSSTGERDIYTGDAGEIFVIGPNGVEKHDFELKLD